MYYKHDIVELTLTVTWVKKVNNNNYCEPILKLHVLVYMVHGFTIIIISLLYTQVTGTRSTLISKVSATHGMVSSYVHTSASKN